MIDTEIGVDPAQPHAEVAIMAKKKCRIIGPLSRFHDLSFLLRNTDILEVYIESRFFVAEDLVNYYLGRYSLE